MNEPAPLNQAVAQVYQFLEGRGIGYALVGGLAVAVWGEPRATFDIDVALAVRPSEVEQFIDFVRGNALFQLPPEHLQFGNVRIIRAHVLDSSGHEPDLILVEFLILDPRFLESLMGRRVSVELNARQIWVCSAEDLIVLKLLAAREKDRLDIRGLLASRGRNLDVEYVSKWAKQLGVSESWKALQPQ